MPKRNDVTQVIFYVYDKTTGDAVSGQSAGTVSVYLAKDGGAFSRITSPAITAVDAANMPGFYRLALTGTQTDAAHIVVRFASATPGTVIEACERYFENYSSPADIPAAPTATQIADAILARDVAEVENNAPLHSLCTIVLAHLESRVAGTQWQIRRSDGSTQHALLAVSTDPNAEAVTGVSS